MELTGSVTASETSTAYHRMLELVGKLRQERGHGTWAQLDQRLGHSEGYLGRVLRQEIRLTADMLLRILQVLDVDPGLFFQQVFTPCSDPAVVLELLQRQMSGLRRADGSKEPDLDMVTLAWLQDLQSAARRLEGGPQDVVDGSLRQEHRAFAQELAEMQGRLETQPQEVVEELSVWLPRVAGQLVAQQDGVRDLLAKGLAMQSQALVLGVRPCEVQPMAAVHHVRTAWELARSTEARAEVLLSAAQLALRVGALRSTQWLMSRATEMAVLVHRPQTLGRVVLLRGQLHLRCREWRQGTETFSAALSYLDEAAHLPRYLAHLGLARCALKTDQLAAAEQALLQAESLEVVCGQQPVAWTQGQRARLQASLAEAHGRWDEAATLYASARHMYAAEGHLAAALLVALREARVLLSLGEQPALRQLTADCMGWTRSLRRQRRMCEVITEMARLAWTPELTPQWLQRAEVELKPLADLHDLSGMGLS